MKYVMAFVLLFMSGAAQAQIARITRDGTTVYSDQGQIYTPSEESIARQQQQRMQQQQRVQQQQRQLAQQKQPQNDIKQQNAEKTQMSRSLIKNGGDQRKAFNVMILQEVSTYKLGDEEIAKEVDGLKNNSEYYRKLDIIKKKLSNSKMSDTKNKEVMNILNDAGNRIYNLLGN